MSTDEGRWLEGLDERTERERMEAAQPSASQPDGLAEVVSEALRTSRLTWGTHSDRWGDRQWQREFWDEAGEIAATAIRAHLAQTAPEQPDAVVALDEVIHRLMHDIPVTADGYASVEELEAVVREVRAELTTTPPAAQVAERQDEA